MIILSGNTLGKRQKELNEKVNIAIESDFTTYKAELNDKNDIDKIFLIDLAAKNKNIDFILEIIKSGDNLYITRAINKCKWITEDDFANHININNLQLKVFPFMSPKMKKKFLTHLAADIKNNDRSIAFYEFCMKEDLFAIALKFLNHTNEEFKLKIIQQKGKAFELLYQNMDDIIKNFIGNSFTLARTMLECMDNDWERSPLVVCLHYMYTFSDVLYLDMLEKYKKTETYKESFGHRMSKDIIKKHKERVLKNPVLYLKHLNESKVARNSTVNDVKTYAVALLPDKADGFWNYDYYNKYKFILDILPTDEKFSYIKKIFTEKYPGEPFETRSEFYFKHFYLMMSEKEKENWALEQIERGEEIHGDGKDYVWYKFVNFDKAFTEIKKYVQKTTNSDDRADILDVLIQAAKSQDDIETLLKYYYDRHVNEKKQYKINFIVKLHEKHSALLYKDECWILFEKIMYSADLFDVLQYNCRQLMFASIALVYYIMRNKVVPSEVSSLLKSSGRDMLNEVQSICKDLEREKVDMVMQYLLKFYLSAVETLATIEYNDDVKSQMKSPLKRYLEVLIFQNKTKDDIPAIIDKFIKLDWESFNYYSIFKDKSVNFSEKLINRSIKKDANFVIDQFTSIEEFIKSRWGNTNWLTKKLKLYFHHDIGQKYLQLLYNSINTEDAHHHMTSIAVHGILTLADETSKLDFVQKHAPTEPKIDHKNIPQHLLYIQKAICSQALVCRPPLPLTYLHQYLTGDYVHSCLPIFNYYLMNLPPSACLTFVESVIYKPIKIQKHGLRLAFQCFSVESLKTLITDIWKKSKNISIRKVLFKSLYDKILKERDQTQIELFDVLIVLTRELREDDDDEIFSILDSYNLPVNLRGKLLLTAWDVVERMPVKPSNFDKLTRIIRKIHDYVKLISPDKVKSMIDSHISSIFNNETQDHEKLKYSRDELNKVKWDLTLNYLASIYNDEELGNNMILIKHIIQTVIERMRENTDCTKAFNFLWLFANDLQNKSYCSHSVESYPFMKIVFNYILQEIHESGIESYKLLLGIMQLRLMEITRDIITMGKEANAKDTVKSNAKEIISKCLELFSSGLLTLHKEYISNGKYYASLRVLFKSYIINEIEQIHCHMGHNPDLCTNDDLIYLTCNGLLDSNIPEVNILILELLPAEFTGLCIEQYKDLLCKVGSIENEEIQSYYFTKFVLRCFEANL